MLAMLSDGPLIDDGHGLYIDVPSGHPFNILPRGVRKSIKKVHRKMQLGTNLLVICVEFTNGASVDLKLDRGGRLKDSGELILFQAHCLMVHDI